MKLHEYHQPVPDPLLKGTCVADVERGYCGLDLSHPKHKEPPSTRRPKCPRCLNKNPARITCQYCGGMGRI